jgi:preprotein translocase subunit SecF
MAFGVFVATFSSIYVAGPILLWIESKYPRTTSDSTSRAVNAGNDAAAGKGSRKAERVGAR